MAGIITNVGEDIKSLQQLRQEIENVKKALGSIDINVKIDIRKELEQRLQSLTKQYDTLVAKAAEADAKLMESAKRIDKAVDTITAAQEKVAKANTQQAADMTDKVQASAVEVQTKAYLDLKDEIDAVLGTREQNIQQMLQEQNAIRIINAEIAQINKSRQYGGGLTATQSQRLQQLNDDLLTHKQALAEVRQELNNNAKLDIAAVGSMNELSQSLSRMKIAYRALNEDERNSQFGKSLLASIQEADAKIKELDATIGNHQRNVGNYQGSFNGLNMSVQQIVRELPAAKMGINMFFMAISNNLPIMVDQIKYAKEANAAMKAAGQEPVPVWKQLVSSLFSWQSAMMVGITLLTIYGKDIANWVKDLFKANDAQEQARKEAEAFAKTVQKAHKEWQNSVAQTAAQQITEYKKMQHEWNKLGNDLNAKKKYVNANRDAFHQLGFAVNGVSDAERVMTGNTDAVVASIMARAKASAYYAQMQEATERYIKQTEYNKNTVKGGGYHNVAHIGDVLTVINGENADEKMAKLGFSKNDYKLEWAGGQSGMVKVVATASGAARQTRINAAKSAKILAENQKKAKDQLDQQISSLQGGLEATVKENQDLLKKIGVSEYKNYEDQKEKKKKEAKQVDYDKMAREQSEAERNLENAVAQSRIDAMQEGYEKEKAQRELNHKKELNDIDKQRSDFLRRKINDAKQIFNANPRNKGKKFNYSSVTLSAAEQGKFNEMRANILKKHANEEKDYQKQQIQALNDYLKEYGSMQEKRLAIAKEYDEKITKAKSEGERLSLNAQKAKALSDFDLTEEKKNLNWEDIFGDLTNQTIGQLEKVRAKLREMLNSDNLNVEGYKTAVEQIEKVNNAIIDAQDKQRSFFDFSTSYTKERRKLEMDVADALQRQADAIANQKNAHGKVWSKQIGAGQLLSNYGVNHNGDITASKTGEILKEVEKKYGTDSEAYKKVRDAMEDLAASERELIEANEKKKNADSSVVKSQGKLDNFLGDLQGKLKGFGESFDMAMSNLNSLPDLLFELGVSAESSVMKGVKDLAEAGNAAQSAMKDFMSGNFIGAASNGIHAFKSLGSSIGHFFSGDNDKEVRRTTERLTASNKELAKRIDSLSDTIGSSAGAKAVNAYDTALKAQKEINKNNMDILKAQMRNYGKHHSNSYYANDRIISSYNKDAQLAFKAAGVDSANIAGLDSIYSLSPEQLNAIRNFAPNLWKYLTEVGKNDKKEYWDAVVEQAGKTEKLTEQIKNNLTQTSFDSLRSGFLDTLMNMDADAEDWSNNFSKMLFRSMVNKSVLNDSFDKWLKDFQNKWADKVNSGKMSQADYAAYRDEYNNKMMELKNQTNNLASAVGYSDASSSQKATANGVSSITFEQANNIVALTTAGNISRDQIKDILTAKLSTMDASMRGIQMMAVEQKSIADELRTIQANSYIELQGIHEDTTAMNKAIKSMSSDVSDIKKRIKDM